MTNMMSDIREHVLIFGVDHFIHFCIFFCEKSIVFQKCVLNVIKCLNSSDLYAKN